VHQRYDPPLPLARAAINPSMHGATATRVDRRSKQSSACAPSSTATSLPPGVHLTADAACPPPAHRAVQRDRRPAPPIRPNDVPSRRMGHVGPRERGAQQRNHPGRRLGQPEHLGRQHRSHKLTQRGHLSRRGAQEMWSDPVPGAAGRLPRPGVPRRMGAVQPRGCPSVQAHDQDCDDWLPQLGVLPTPSVGGQHRRQATAASMTILVLSR
jgi:hypothetical protein